MRVDPASDLPATLYLNVLASAKPLLAETPDPSRQARITAIGQGLVVDRYAP